MKFIFATFGFLLFLWIPLQAQQFVISGNIIDDVSNKQLPGIEISTNQLKTLSKSDGKFELIVLTSGIHVLTISGEGFESMELEVNVTKAASDLGTLRLKTSNTQSEIGVTEITLSDDDSNEQSVSGLLQSSSDAYVSAASYSFSPMFFKMRGFDQEYQNVYMNGVPVNDAETGRAVWNEWGGLNDVLRNKQYVNGLAPADFSLSGIGGATNINTRPSLQRKQTKVTYSLANKSYNNRAMFTYSTGMLPNNWAITVSGSRRWSQEGYTEGTNYESYSWFAGIEKKINAHHSISLVSYGAPYRRAQSGPATQEAYDLTGSNYYNPNWGMQEGKKRNARIRSANEPMFILNHFWQINDKTKITSAVAYSFGKTGTTALNWYRSADPRPDYYRYLPSYFTDPSVVADLTSSWQNNISVSQIDWNRLYQINYLANNEEKQARYVIENNITSQNQLFISSKLTKETGIHGLLSAGLEFTSYNGSHYKEMNDLLGGKYWLDIDQFSERDFASDTIMLQNDLNNPNRIIKVGDKFGYDYTLSQSIGKLWALQKWTFNHFDYYLGGAISYNQFSREGNMRNGRHPENSYGKSKVSSYISYDVKGGATYKITGRHYFETNIARLMNPPSLRDAYISPRTSNIETPGFDQEVIYSGDLSYIARFPGFNARVTVYETYFDNHSEIMRYYHDDLLTYVNMAITGQKRIHQGIEAGAQVKITSWLSAMVAGSIGNYRYTNRPTATISFDNGSQPDTTETIYVKNFFVSGTPQAAGTAGLKFNKNYWFIDVSMNYFDKIYLSFNPNRRTQTAIENLPEGAPLITTITQQEKLKGGFTLDASIGKSFRIKTHFLAVNLSISNLLNNTDLKTGGYEQLRFDFENKNINKFPPKYFYAYGRTFFCNVSFRL